MRGTFDCPLRVGQRVRHTDYKGQRVTGVIHGLTVCNELGLMVDCKLDAPIVIPADEYSGELKIWSQLAQAHEFTPFEERDELIEELRAELQSCVAVFRTALAETPETDQPKHSVLTARMKACGLAVAKAKLHATGSAA